jgi:hypothetical protein
MRIKHTSLGALRSSKKLIAGVAALALVGGIAPTLISNTHAATDDTLYTTVGPFYYTTSGLDLDWINDNDATVRVADTSVADFYGYSDEELDAMRMVSPVSTESLETTTLDLDGMVSETYPGVPDDDYDGPLWYDYCDERYACLQGKKVGETEIIISRDGEEDIRIPLKSVELTPKARNLTAAGNTVSGTGSLNGADDSLLRIRGTYRSENVALTVKGERGYSVSTSSEGSIRDEIGGEIIWTIGRQTVGGGTYFDFFPIKAVDTINGNKTNEKNLRNSVVNIVDTVYSDPEKYESIFASEGDIYNFPLNDGSIVNIYNRGRISGGVEASFAKAISVPSYDERGFLVELTAAEPELSNSEENKLTDKMPKNAEVVDFSDIEAVVYRYYYSWNGGGNYYQMNASMLMSGLGGTSDVEDSDYELVKQQVADFVKLGKAISLTVTVEAPEADKVAAGYTRKWYATYNEGNKVNRIEVDYNEKNNTLSFETHYFGAYAFGYVDEKNRDFVPAVPDTGVAPSKVITTAVATFLPLVGIAGAAFIIRSKKHAAHKLAKKHNHFE